tara:strand:- start:85 stop:555 length:471 start_codon:yes stop_codon:yes gene_type:complete
MKNNKKGFTLIELLVVVAIIGILAAVGVVAYNGYTAGAKQSAAKSNHATVLKYIAAEVQKCNIDPQGEAMGGELDCNGRTRATIMAAAVDALSEFENPYSGDEAVRSGEGSPSGDDDDGFTNIDEGTDDNVITVQTCWRENACTSENILGNDLEIE